MKIETKYNVGDIVHLMHDQGVLAKATTAKILTVHFTQDDSNFQKGNITYKYALKQKGTAYYDEANTSTCNEVYLFPTKEELLASL